VFAGVALSALVAGEKSKTARRRRSRKRGFSFGTPEKLEQ